MKKFLGSHDDSDPVEIAIWAARMHDRAYDVKFDGLIDERVIVAYVSDDDDATEDEMREWVHS